MSRYLRDLEEIKSEVLSKISGAGRVLVLNVWCLKWVARKGEVEDWRRALFWESPAV